MMASKLYNYEVLGCYTLCESNRIFRRTHKHTLELKRLR